MGEQDVGLPAPDLGAHRELHPDKSPQRPLGIDGDDPGVGGQQGRVPMAGEHEAYVVMLAEPFPEILDECRRSGDDIGRKDTTGDQDAHT